jgi:Tol biopolymer transport system component
MQVENKPPLSVVQPPNSSPDSFLSKFHFTHFDRLVGLIVLLLLGLISAVLLLGDRVGVTLKRVGPLGTARSTSAVLIEFSEAMNRESVAARLRVFEVPPEQMNTAEPANALAEVTGTITWKGTALRFQPDHVLRPGSSYQVILEAGAASETGRLVLDEYRYGFIVRRPRVAYLAPSSRPPFNIWIADPADPSSARQITFSPSGIYDYSVSPDGSQIAFSERNTNTGTMDIKLLDLETGGIQQITDCTDAECARPVWRPDGQWIAYERIDLNSDLGGQVGVSPTRIWIVDLTAQPYANRPLFSDSQILGYGLRWSGDGSRVAVFDSGSMGILVYDFRDDSTVLIPSSYGNSGELSPDGTQLVYPKVVLAENQAFTNLELVDLAANEIRPLSFPPEAVDDDAAVWSPDGSFLVIARRYLDSRFTRGKQLYKLNPIDGSVETLLYDPLYQNGLFSLDPTGTQLVIQRFPDPAAMNDPNNPRLPEVWTLDMTSSTLVKVSADAFLSRWVP